MEDEWFIWHNVVGDFREACPRPDCCQKPHLRIYFRLFLHMHLISQPSRQPSFGTNESRWVVTRRNDGNH